MGLGGLEGPLPLPGVGVTCEGLLLAAYHFSETRKDKELEVQMACGHG